MTPELWDSVALFSVIAFSTTGALLVYHSQLGSFIVGFKSAVTTRINQTRDTAGIPVWQRNYYEHIVRNERELDAIRFYIANNPANWSADIDNPNNVPRRQSPQTVGDYVREVGLKT